MGREGASNFPQNVSPVDIHPPSEGRSDAFSICTKRVWCYWRAAALVIGEDVCARFRCREVEEEQGNYGHAGEPSDFRVGEMRAECVEGKGGGGGRADEGD